MPIMWCEFTQILFLLDVTQYEILLWDAHKYGGVALLIYFSNI
jgi:hypothetical protein